MENGVMDITIVCMKWGDSFGPEYVNKLYSGVRRHIRRHTFDFICYTDKPDGIRDEVKVLPLLCEYPTGWEKRQKIALFRETLPGVQTERIFYFDLACVIVGDLDEVIDMATDFAICRDWPPEMRPDDNGYASGAFLLRVGSQKQVWEQWKRPTTWGDQAWITKTAPGADVFPYDWSPSYKLRNLQERGCPKDAKWIMFHGSPKPHECGGWVKDMWK
jgi:hypothetical protein